MNEGQATCVILTAQDCPPVPDKTAHNFQCLRASRPGFVQGESVQPLKDGLDLILSKNFLHKFLCVGIESKYHTRENKTNLVFPALLASLLERE